MLKEVIQQKAEAQFKLLLSHPWVLQDGTVDDSIVLPVTAGEQDEIFPETCCAFARFCIPP